MNCHGQVLVVTKTNLEIQVVFFWQIEICGRFCWWKKFYFLPKKGIEKSLRTYDAIAYRFSDMT